MLYVVIMTFGVDLLYQQCRGMTTYSKVMTFVFISVEFHLTNLHQDHCINYETSQM